MTPSEMLPTVRSLSCDDKLRLIQLLTDDVAHKTVPVWSPFDSFQGAATLLRVEERAATIPVL